MNDKLLFEELKEKNFPLLEQYVPVVARVHGGSHPEFHDVHKEYDSLVSEVNSAGDNEPKLDEQFTSLRKITDDYKIPSEVCETYEAVYEMLAELDKAYMA